MVFDPDVIWRFIETTGTPGVFLVFIVMVSRGLWVPRWAYDEERAEKEHWRAIAFEQARLAHRGISTASDVIDLALRPLSDVSGEPRDPRKG